MSQKEEVLMMLKNALARKSGGCCGSGNSGGALASANYMGGGLSEKTLNNLKAHGDYTLSKPLSKKPTEQEIKNSFVSPNNGKTFVKYTVTVAEMQERLESRQASSIANKSAVKSAVESYKNLHPTKKGVPGNISYLKRCEFACREKAITRILKSEAKSKGYTGDNAHGYLKDPNARGEAGALLDSGKTRFSGSQGKMAQGEKDARKDIRVAIEKQNLPYSQHQDALKKAYASVKGPRFKGTPIIRT